MVFPCVPRSPWLKFEDPCLSCNPCVPWLIDLCDPVPSLACCRLGCIRKLLNLWPLQNQSGDVRADPFKVLRLFAEW